MADTPFLEHPGEHANAIEALEGAVSRLRELQEWEGWITFCEGEHYSAGATPREAAQLLDAIFRHHYGIRPHPEEGDDYAVGAEW